MKIVLQSSLNLKETVLETQSTTVRALFDEVLKNRSLPGMELYYDGQRGRMYPGCALLVNERLLYSLADGLETRLNDGDKIDIIVVFVGG